MSLLKVEFIRIFLLASIVLGIHNSYAQNGETIRMAVIKATVLAPALLVQKHLPSNWKTEITYFTSPSDMSNAILSDSVDIAYTGFTIAVVARSKDQPIVVIANQAGKGTGIVVRADSTIKTIADLKGKRVGNLTNSIHDVLLREELKKAKISFDEISVIRLGPADMPAALMRGDIDAFAGNEPNVTQSVMSGVGRVLLYPYDNSVGTINVGVISSEKIVKQKEKILKVWAMAHAKATEELSKNPDLWADLVSKEWGYDREATKRSLSNIELKWKIDDLFMSQFNVYSERLKDLGVVQKVPNINSLIDRQFVNQVKL